MWMNFQVHVSALNFSYQNAKLFLLQVSVIPGENIQNIQHFGSEV